uniref:Transmembrane protein n=1 Tax=viral metagenome TaxID=1070528 RepID=A0A6C0K7B4_9ZZZZ
MSATSTPQFYTTAFPTTTPTYSPTQNATLPIVVVDVQGTNMTTTNALLGSTLALIIVAVALAAGRYLPAGWAQRCRRMIPQSTIDNFKRDPLGSVTAMVNDPKSVLKNIQIPDSVRNLSDMVPQSIKDKIVPKEIQDLVGIAPSATVPHIDTETPAERPESVTPETSPPPPASSRKIDIAPPPPVRRAITPEPIAEEKEEEVKAEAVREVIEDGGVVVTEPKKEEQVASTILKIDPADLEAVQAFLESRSGSHVILQSNSGSITDEARL